MLIFRGPGLKTILSATPVDWLVSVQVYRALGAMFLVLYGVDRLPPEFALPAGFGDVAVGMLALPVAAYYGAGGFRSDTLVVLWNVFGIADLVIAVTTGFLSSPTPLQMLAFDRPNTLAGAYPLVLIPVFAVPLSIVLHIATLHRLGQTASSDTA